MAMGYYSLVSSLPVLRIGDEPPFSVERYVQDCAQWVTEREADILRKVLLAAPDIVPCALCRKLHDLETQIRNAVARQRAQRLGVDATEYLHRHDGFEGVIETGVSEAFSQNDPIELEQGLDRLRWRLADDLVPLDNPFGFERVLAYGIQLKIIERWSRMDPHKGKETLEKLILENTESTTEENASSGQTE
jgi:hypothetical protein